MQIIRRIKGKLSGLLGYKNGAAFIPNENDVMFVGYPKSGNTWLDFLVASLVSPLVEDVNFLSIEKIVADIYFNDGLSLNRLSPPRLLKSHEPHNKSYGKVVYIVRDPRDVAVSYFFHHIRLKIISRDFLLEEFVERFVDGGWDSFGAWDKHVEGWLEKREGTSDFLFVKYEDMKNDIDSAVVCLASFLKVELTDAKRHCVIDWCSIENMKRLEAQSTLNLKVVEGMPFVRRGKSKGWLEIMDEHSRERIEDRYQAIMKQIGYL